jgi:hypothetical protein
MGAIFRLIAEDEDCTEEKKCTIEAPQEGRVGQNVQISQSLCWILIWNEHLCSII